MGNCCKSQRRREVKSTQLCEPVLSFTIPESGNIVPGFIKESAYAVRARTTGEGLSKEQEKSNKNQILMKQF
jgi:hypothetical protein